MTRRGSQPRERYQARVNLHDGMAELWDFVMSYPERSRVHALIVAATLGARLARGAMERAAAVSGAGAPAPSQPVASVPVLAKVAEAVSGPRCLDPVGAETVSAGLAGWDMSTDFDAVAPMQ